jgi:hypothetical protein
MIDLESGAPIPAPATCPDVVLVADAEGQTLLGSGNTSLPADAGGDSVLSYDDGSIGDEWIAQMLSTASSDTIATLLILPGGDVLLDPQSYDGEDLEDIVITGKRLHDTGGYTGGAGGYTGGYTGYTGGGTDGGGGGTPSPTGAEQHTQDCGTEDGAAVQVAKHVTGALPPGVSGPPDPVTTSTGNDWRSVEFGAVIIRNVDGSFGALNDMIYSSNLQGYAALPSGVGQPVQGLWHSHPTRGGSDQWAIDRYPSPDDWASLARVAGQAGAAANPSLWITAPDGVTREFQLSERAYFESLSADPSKMINGEGLDGRERTQSCG